MAPWIHAEETACNLILHPAARGWENYDVLRRTFHGFGLHALVSYTRNINKKGGGGKDKAVVL